MSSPKILGFIITPRFGLALVAGLAFIFYTTFIGGARMPENIKTKSYCVGRFIFEVPEEFNEFVFGPSDIAGVNFELIGPGTQADADNLTAQRIRAAKQGDELGEGVPQILKAVVEIGNLKIIERYSDYDLPGYQNGQIWYVETYIHSNGTIYRLSTATDDETKQWAYDTVTEVAKGLRPKAPEEIPTGAGVCVASHTYYEGPLTAFIHSGYFFMPDRSNFKFSMFVRGPSDSPYSTDGRFQIRSRSIEIAGMKGEQVFLIDHHKGFGSAMVHDLDKSGLNGAHLRFKMVIKDERNLPKHLLSAEGLFNFVTSHIRRKPS